MSGSGLRTVNIQVETTFLYVSKVKLCHPTPQELSGLKNGIAAGNPALMFSPLKCANIHRHDEKCHFIIILHLHMHIYTYMYV